MQTEKASISLVAKKAGVSNATVSRVLNHPELVNENTVKAVTAAMEELKYIPQPFKSRGKEAKKLIIINFPDLSNPFYGDIINGLVSSADSHSYHVLVHLTDFKDDAALDNLLDLIKETSACGVVLASALRPDYYRQIASIVPLVQCCEYNTEDYSYVSIDDFKASYTAMEHIYSNGRKKIAFINGPANFKYAIERFRGYEAFLQYSGLSFHDSWNINLPAINYDMAFAASSQLLTSQDPPDAVFAASDVIAAAVIKAAKVYSIKVPEDLIVVGFDNVSISTISDPAITTISQPRFQLGYSAGEILNQHITNSQKQVQRLLLNTELIIRESSSHNNR